MAKLTLLLFLFTCFIFSSSFAFQSDELLVDDDEFGLEGGAKPHSTEPYTSSSSSSSSSPQQQQQTPTIRKRYSDPTDLDSKVQFTLQHAFGDSDFSPAGTFSARLKSWSHGGKTLTKLRFSRNDFSAEDMNKPEVLDLSTDNVPKDEATKPVKETELPESGTSVKSKTAKDNKTVKKKSAGYKKWEKAAIDGVSLVADAAEHLERTSIHKDMDGQKDLGPIRYLTGKSPLSICSSGDVPLSDANMQFSAKLKLQLFPIDESTRRSLEMDKHNPHLELALNNRKKISSVLEHLNRKWGSSN